MIPFLPDVNLLLALGWEVHPHHARASAWLRDQADRPMILCEINTAGFIRISGNPAVFDPPQDFSDSWRWLERLASGRPAARAVFDRPAWDRFGKAVTRIQGHRQVADSMLLSLAADADAKFATFDTKFRHLSPDPGIVEIVPLL